jgi:hypothetical protein
MEILNFSGQEGSGSKKSSKSRAFIGIGLIAAAIGFSSTLAANISINSGPVEFGQGVAQTVACSGDESIIVTPATSFTNAPSSVEREITFYGGDTVTVESTENLSVGMLLALQSDVPYVITEINGLVVRMSQEVVEGGWSLPMTFTPSSGTEQTRTPLDVDGDPYAAGIGVSSMVLDSTSIEVGMLVSGPGIPANTTVVYTGVSFSDSGEGIYIELSKDTEYSPGEVTFTNSGKSSFKLSDITVSGIPDTCTNKVFTIKLYDNESSEPLRISDFGEGDTSVQVWWANGYQAPDYGSTQENEAVVQFPAQNLAFRDSNGDAFNGGYAVETARSTDLPTGAFKINLPIPVDASRVYKITVESQDDSDAFNVGDVENYPDFNFYDWRDWS